MSLPWRVAKVGGSLLELPDWDERLLRWYAREPPGRMVVITGGGVWADQVRRIDQRLGLPPAQSHWMAVQAMRLTARLVHLQTRWPLVERFAELPAAALPLPVLLDVNDFLRNEEQSLPGVVLEMGWHVTSDSIAARLAVVLRACQLVLLKSSLPRSRSLAEASRDQYLDAFLPTLSPQLGPIRCVNLRDTEMSETTLG